MTIYTEDLQPGDTAILVFPERFLDEKQAIIGLGMTLHTNPFQKGNSKKLFVVDIPRRIFNFLKHCWELEKSKSARRIYPNVVTRCGCDGAYLRPAIKTTVIKQLPRSVLAKFDKAIVLYVNYGEPWIDGVSDHVPSYSKYWKDFEDVFEY